MLAGIKYTYIYDINKFFLNYYTLHMVIKVFLIISLRRVTTIVLSAKIYCKSLKSVEPSVEYRNFP